MSRQILIHVPATPLSEHKGKFKDLQFHPELKARGRPKRSERQFAFSTKLRVDRVETEDGRGRRRQMNAGQAPSTKRQQLSKTMCLVCDLPSQVEKKER